MWRWMRRQCRCSFKCCFLLVVTGVLCFVLFVAHLIRDEACTNEMSKQIIHDMCALYHSGEFAGSYCEKLCNTEHLQFTSCTNYKQGKKVFFLNCDDCVPGKKDIKVVFKMKETIEERDRLGIEFEQMPEDEDENSVQTYENTIKSMLLNSYMFKFSKNMSSVEDILSFTWGWDFESFLQDSHGSRTQAIGAAARNIWSLSEQHEYLMNRMLEEQIFFPKIYGTCGPAYFLEFTQSMRKYEYEFYNSWSQPWKERAKLAIKLINLIHTLDHDLHQTLHLCDVKPDNFGFRDVGEVTLIDTDCAMFHTDLMQQFNYSKCSAHADCDFFDCRGYCDVKNNQCLRKRTNNNLQALCEDVFQGFSVRFPTGLLRDPPSTNKAEIYNALNDCTYPEKSTASSDVRAKTPWTAGKTLQSVLRKSLE